MEIIALSGFARSGKDEAAKVLVEEFEFTQVAFADKLREVLYALNPMCGRGWDASDRPVVYVQDVIDEYGWGGYKETEHGNEIRRLLQRLGTEAGRQTLWDSIWIDAALANQPEDAKIVVSDARFINEFEAVRQRGGKIWRINRWGVGPLNDHASEMEATTYKKFDVVIENNDTLENYQSLVRQAYKSKSVLPVVFESVFKGGIW